MPTLSLKHRDAAATAPTSATGMKLFINGTQVQKWFGDTAGWKTFSYDLSAYKGTSVTIQFCS